MVVIDRCVYDLGGFSSYSAVSGHQKGDNERLCAMNRPSGSERMLPLATHDPLTHAKPVVHFGSADAYLFHVQKF